MRRVRVRRRNVRLGIRRRPLHPRRRACRKSCQWRGHLQPRSSCFQASIKNHFEWKKKVSIFFHDNLYLYQLSFKFYIYRIRFYLDKRKNFVFCFFCNSSLSKYKMKCFMCFMCLCKVHIFFSNPFNFGDATNASIDKVDGFSSTNFVKFEFHSEFALDVIVNISAFLQ